MRVIVTVILLCMLLQACGSKGALVLPPEKDVGQQAHTNKQN